MIAWLRRTRQTHTPVHDENALKRERESGLRLGYQALGAVQLLLQMLLWLVMAAYDQTVQATWQAALMLVVPLAALWFIWRKAGTVPWGDRGTVQPGKERTVCSEAPGAARQARAAAIACCLLLPCLLTDCYLLLRASEALLTDMIPVFPTWARIGIVTLFPLMTAWLGKGKGVAYTAYFMRFYLPVLFGLSTVLAAADIDGTRLWPLLGPGLAQTAETALGGAGACWGVALLYLFPQRRARPRGREGPGAALFLWLPLALCVLWALWMGLTMPWRAGDGLTPGQRMTGISQLSDSVLLGEAGALFWMTMLPLGLAGVVGGGEQLLRGVFPRLPRFLADGLALLPGLVGLCLLPAETPAPLRALLPWRFVLSALSGVALIFLGRKGRG